jgi:hypothetical protein
MNDLKRFAFWIFLGVVAIAMLLLSCTDDSFEKNCGTPAVVRDLRGLDGCNYVFELTDGTRLIPVFNVLYCGTPPLPKEVTEHPLYGFEFVDGKRVLIGYEQTHAQANICMAGVPVNITFLQEIDAP